MADGQVLISRGPGSNLAGTAGNDTIFPSTGPDVVTGGPGADVFLFQALPYSAGHITDFALGVDRLQSYYWDRAPGADLIAQGRVVLEPDGAGGTKVFFDRDAVGSGEWPTFLVTLDNVPHTSITWSLLAYAGTAAPSFNGLANSPDLQNYLLEANLPAGSAPDPQALKLSSRFYVSAADGIDDLTGPGFSIIRDGLFTPVSLDMAAGSRVSFDSYNAATGEISYTYELKAGSLQPFPVSSLGFGLDLTDKDGDRATASFSVAVVNDKPVLSNDSDTVVAGQRTTATGNLLTDQSPGDLGDGDAGADRLGADGGRLWQILGGDAGFSDTPAGSETFTQGGELGYIVVSASGDYTYYPYEGGAAGRHDQFVYTVRDGDGDLAHAVLVIDFLPPEAPEGGGGQVISSPGPGSILQGTVGADTLIASQGPDQLTGGAGHDHFTFRALPWRAGVVTDFTDGADRIDLRALYQASGYTGPDAVADRYVHFESDGAGGTRVMYDTDGTGAGQAWSFHITTLQGVAPSSLSNADLVGGSTGGNETQPGQEPSQGQVLTSSQPGDTLSGASGADTLNASQGADQLTGAGGADRFVFAKPPWSAGVITDFAAGSDKIDVSALLDAYTGSNPMADGWLRLDEVGGSTKVYVDIDGAGGEWPFLITTLQAVSAGSVSLSDFIV